MTPLLVSVIMGGGGGGGDLYMRGEGGTPIYEGEGGGEASSHRILFDTVIVDDQLQHQCWSGLCG